MAPYEDKLVIELLDVDNYATWAIRIPEFREGQ